jgi:hypothetical protein
MMLKYHIYNNSQNRNVYKYTNLKGKLILCNDHINFNNICLNKNISPKYAKLIKKKTYSNNKALTQTKEKAQIIRLKQEIKLLYKKKQHINNELYKIHLYNMHIWKESWDNTEHNINKKLHKEIIRKHRQQN